MYELDVAMKDNLQKTRRLLNNFEKELENLPSGSLYIKTVNQHSYYYHSYRINGKWKRTYLKPKVRKDAILLGQLQRRRFILKSIPILKNNIRALEQAAKKFQIYDPEIICSNMAPAYLGVESDRSIWLPGDLRLKTWAKSSYQRNTAYPEDLIYKTICGIKVRSKSESMIADILSYLGIPFRYEQLIPIGEKTYAPDFVLLRPKDYKQMYWEHFGRMDKEDYVLDHAKKIMDYREAGIITGDNLIQTYEDRAHPMTMKEVYETINLHLL